MTTGPTPQNSPHDFDPQVIATGHHEPGVAAAYLASLPAEVQREIATTAALAATMTDDERTRVLQLTVDLIDRMVADWGDGEPQMVDRLPNMYLSASAQILAAFYRTETPDVDHDAELKENPDG